MNKLKVSRAIVVEGRDDVAAVSEACEALIIPTHGFGITAETWKLIEKAYKEKGLIILTDPDFSGEEIRRKLSARFPDSIQAYIAKADALLGDDIGVENAKPEIIAEAIETALKLDANAKQADERETSVKWQMSDLVEYGLSGYEGSAELRERLCAKLGIGNGNSKALIKKFEHWNIGREELEQAIKEIQK